MDELNNLKTRLENSKSLNEAEVIDEIFDLLIIAYMNGNKAANFDLSSDYEIETDNLQNAIYHKIEGMDFADRIREHIKNGDSIEDIFRVADTETHRVYNTALFDVAEISGANKTWVTMMDEKVRETHAFLEGVTIPWDERFYTYDGDSAEFPGGFELASNNVNCRCEIVLTK